MGEKDVTDPYRFRSDRLIDSFPGGVHALDSVHSHSQSGGKAMTFIFKDSCGIILIAYLVKEEANNEIVEGELHSKQKQFLFY